MTEIKINKTFPSLRECDEWEAENLKDYVPAGKVMLMVNHSQSAGTDEVILESIYVC